MQTSEEKNAEMHNESLKRNLIRFFSDGSNTLQTEFVNQCLDAFSNGNADALEIIGIIYKYVSREHQLKLFDAVCNANITSRSDLCVSFFNFYRFVSRGVDARDRNRLLDILNKIKEKAGYASTAEYLIEMNVAEPILQENAHVLLLIPEFLSSISFLQPPIDFMTVAKILEENGVACDILDNRVFNYPQDRMMQIISRYDHIVVTSTPIDMVQKYFIDYRYAYFCYTLSEIIKAYPQKNLFVVGPHGTVAKELLLKDIPLRGEQIIQGEYESTLSDRLLEYFIKGNKNTDPLTHTPDYSKIELKWYFGREFKNNVCLYRPNMAIMQLSRGCPFACEFCYDFYGHNVRFKSFQTITEEFELLKKAKAANIFFIDQTFTLNRALIIRICRYLIANNLNFVWQCETRAELLDKQLICLMKKAGCSSIWLGIESFSQNVLNKNNKGINVDEIYNALKLCKDCGMELCGFIMLGMPGETKETLHYTVNEIKRLGLHISPSVNLCSPRIGSKLFDKMAQDGVKITSFYELIDFEGHTYNNVAPTDLIETEAEIVNFWREQYENNEQ